MDMIEKAINKLDRLSKKSLVERAADKAGSGTAAAAPAADTGPAPATVQAATAATPPQPSPAARKSSRLASIDFERLKARGFVTPGGERTRIGEEFRILKRPLLLTAFGATDEVVPNGHLIMVASARPKEGKTFTAVNLAVSIATERDVTVLLVDADIMNPSVPSVLGIESGKGLVDVLSDDKLDLSEVLIRTDLGNLSVLPAGSPHPAANELLASDKMARLVDDMAKRYSDRIIIFDAPPVLASSETSVLSLHVGQILFVVEAEQTPRRAVDSALELVSRCKNIRLVLNKTRSLSRTEQFGSYYGHYYP
jgi:receptor protein-tyrosine kinase